jgi:Asp-tRNA(Asn)/Glu-tRNA(Gln) amidotransferase C subunit
MHTQDAERLVWKPLVLGIFPKLSVEPANWRQKYMTLRKDYPFRRKFSKHQSEIDDFYDDCATFALALWDLFPNKFVSIVVVVDDEEREDWDWNEEFPYFAHLACEWEDENHQSFVVDITGIAKYEDVLDNFDGELVCPNLHRISREELVDEWMKNGPLLELDQEEYDKAVQIICKKINSL